MKKIITLFFLISCLTFAIPEFENLRWGFTIDAIKGFYPEVQNEFTTSNDVTKYNYYPKDTEVQKIIFYLYENKLYKIISEFDTTRVRSNDVQTIYNNYSDKWGNPTSSVIDETYDDFSIKGNKHTWIIDTTYISFIGQDYFDNSNKLSDSRLMVEYGLIDPTKRENESSLNKLILDN